MSESRRSISGCECDLSIIMAAKKHGREKHGRAIPQKSKAPRSLLDCFERDFGCGDRVLEREFA